MEIHLSVHDIVDFILRSGSVVSATLLSKRAVSGTRLHKKLQSRHEKKASQKGFFFDSEFLLKNTYKLGDYEIYTEGRADGVIEGKDNIYIEEIKSTMRKIDEITEDNIVLSHLAQLKCYGYMYCARYEIKMINLYLTYSDIDGKNEVTFEYRETMEELERFFVDLLLKYCKWIEIYNDIMDRFRETGEKLLFPYGKFRSGQRELSVAVYNTLVSKKQFFVQAPTGTGKTISTLFPAVKYLSKFGGITTKIFYTTAKNQTRIVAEESITKMHDSGLKLKSITLSAKAKICTNKECVCNPESCIYARGHFDRVNDCIYEIIKEKDIIKKDDIIFYAEKYIVCPFELSLDLTLFSQIIICDYNYIYDPTATLDRFFGEDKRIEMPILLIDEAHNFPDRTREMYTAEINTEEMNEIQKILGRSKARQILKKIELIIENYVDNFALKNEYPQQLVEKMQEFMYAIDNLIEKNPLILNKEKIMEFYFVINNFVKISEYFNDNFSIMVEEISDRKINLKLFCADASDIIAQINKKILSIVCFSATFEPIDYFAEVCGGKGDINKALTLSPFPAENLLIVCDDSISTKYKDRGKSYETIADKLYIMAKSKRGNYFAFFSSYSYMNAVWDIFKEKYTEIEVIKQENSMNEEEGQLFLNKFECERDKSLIAFAVLGGIFSEGIDLKNERLIGAAIIGVGLPLICEERDFMMKYYSKKYGKGFDYAYKFPGMNKVLQAAGRVIRTEKDKGVVFLIDERFSQYEYLRLFPKFWKDIKKVSDDLKLKQILESFWS